LHPAQNITIGLTVKERAIKKVGMECDISIHVSGADVSPIVEETEMKKMVWM